MEGDNEYESLPDNTGPGVHMLAGGLAGLAEHTVMYPVDVVKVRHPLYTLRLLLCMTT